MQPYDISAFTTRVTQDADGVYRWSYPMNPRRNKHPSLVIGKVFLFMGVLSAAVLLFVGSPNPAHMSDWAMPLMVLALFLSIFLLITGLLYLQGDDLIPYSMDEEKIITYRMKGSGIHTFAHMRRVRFMPQYDAIHLSFGATLYVPSEDYEAVKAFILAHLPPTADVR